MLGREWIVDGSGCDASHLRDEARIRTLLDRAILELSLNAAQPPLVHKFPGEGGVTALVLLTESHLAVHTFPEHGALTLNLYCCKDRPTWDFQKVLEQMFGATSVQVTVVTRGASGVDSEAHRQGNRLAAEAEGFGDRPTRKMTALEAFTRGQR